jgi:hypothetical protein
MQDEQNYLLKIRLGHYRPKMIRIIEASGDEILK